MARKLTTAEVDNLVERYRSGERQYTIADALGITQASVSRWLQIRGATISRSEAAKRRIRRMTPDEITALTAPAHDAVRGSHFTFEPLCRRALVRERTQSSAVESERVLARWLTERGIDTTPQKAIGPYNADLAAGPVAVEIFGGNWHSHGAHGQRLPHRSRYILDAGWNLYIVWVKVSRHPMLPEMADDLAAFVKRSRRNPAFRGQYRVIWGTGQLIAAGSTDDDELTLIPSSERGDYRRA
jgi:hypothetical protein